MEPHALCLLVQQPARRRRAQRTVRRRPGLPRAAVPRIGAVRREVHDDRSTGGEQFRALQRGLVPRAGAGEKGLDARIRGRSTGRRRAGPNATSRPGVRRCTAGLHPVGAAVPRRSGLLRCRGSPAAAIPFPTRQPWQARIGGRSAQQLSDRRPGRRRRQHRQGCDERSAEPIPAPPRSAIAPAHRHRRRFRVADRAADAAGLCR